MQSQSSSLCCSFTFPSLFCVFFLFYPLVFLPVRGLLCFCSSSLYYLCSCVLWCSQCYFLSSGLFPFLVLCPIFSVQDGDNGGKSTRCCWLMDQNFPLVLFLSQSFSCSPGFFVLFPGFFPGSVIPPKSFSVFLLSAPRFCPFSPFRSLTVFPFLLSRSLIFSGFIARECQAPLQLKRLQSHYCRNRSCGRRRRRRRLISRNGAVCVMGMAICNPVTEVLKSCNQAPG